MLYRWLHRHQSRTASLSPKIQSLQPPASPASPSSLFSNYESDTGATEEVMTEITTTTTTTTPTTAHPNVPNSPRLPDDFPRHRYFGSPFPPFSCASLRRCVVILICISFFRSHACMCSIAVFVQQSLPLSSICSASAASQAQRYRGAVGTEAAAAPGKVARQHAVVRPCRI